MSCDALEVHLTVDPAEFLALAGQHLARDPLLSNVVSSVTQRAAAADERGEPAPGHPRWWATVRAGAEVVGVAMRTAPFSPHPMYVLPMPDEAARALARALHERGEVVHGVNGAAGAGAALAGELVRLAGGAVRIEEHTRLFELGDLVEPRPVEGRLRRAGAGDTEPCLAWFRAFDADAAEQAGRPGDGAEGQVTHEHVVERIEAGRVWLWEDAAGRSRVCLFTDRANPTSNRIYRALGFRPVGDMAHFRLA